MASLHVSLRDALGDYTRRLASARSTGSPADADAIHAAVSSIYADALDKADTVSKSPDVLRSVLDLVARDVAVRPIVDGSIPEPEPDQAVQLARFVADLGDRLDVVLTLFEVANPNNTLDPGILFIPLLEDFIELLSVSAWHEFFGYLESRAPRFCKDMPMTKGTLPLLRVLNTILRSLGHTPADVKLRARVHLFASATITVSDRSAINLRGEYSGITTTWEEDTADVKAEADADGDVKMESSNDSQPDFYSTLWSLQKFFAHPPALGGPAVDGVTPFETFRQKSDFVLSRLYEQTRRERVLRGRNGSPGAGSSSSRKRARDENHHNGDVAEQVASYPRYLTARALLEHEIADQQFRRQILLQYFILFQFLLNLTPGTANKQQFTGGMPKAFVIDGENQAWVKNTVSSIRDELKRMDPHGKRFEETVIQLMDRERRYAQWKNDGCPEKEWSIPPVPSNLASSSAEKWKRQCRPLRRWPYKLGTPGLTRAWEQGYTGNHSDFHRAESKSVFELEQELTRIEMDEEDDKAMGREPGPQVAEQKRTIRWCALRAARKSHPRIVGAMKTYDLHRLVEMIREADAKAKRAGPVEGPGPEGEAEAEAEAEGEAEAEAEAEGAEEAEGEEGTPAAEAEADGEGDGEEDGAEKAKDGEGEGEVKLAELPDDEDEQPKAEGDAEADGDVAMADAAPASAPVSAPDSKPASVSAPDSKPASVPASAPASAPASEPVSALASPERPASEGLGEAE